jgi:predicted nuclease of predicted toxin-antitoxin system
MKFLADVNVSRQVVERLRSRGVDIVRVPEFMDARASDAAIIEEARRRGAVAISHDQDFTAILATTAARQTSLMDDAGARIHMLPVG